MSSLVNKTILITGGASGIGKLMGEKALEKGISKLIIWDLNTQLMQKTADEFRSKGYQVYSYKVDVSDTTAVIETAKKVKSEVGPVDILINNAGVVVGREFVNHTHNDIDFSMNINANALMHVTLEFLPDMIARNSGHIVNISSAAGMISNPNMSVYAASKWAVIGWSESIRLEFVKRKQNIQVTTVTPYYIKTGMFDGVKSPIIPLIEPDNMVKAIIKGIEKNRVFVRKPGLVYFLPFLIGVLPKKVFDWVIGNVFGIYKSMDKFTGHAITPKPEETAAGSLESQKKNNLLIPDDKLFLN